MRTPGHRLSASAAFASLGLGAGGVVFERADPSVLAAPPEELAGWARRHHVALLCQSALFAAGAVPMLVFFAGLRPVLASSGERSATVATSSVVPPAGAAWVLLNLVGQGLQVRMALAAARDRPADAVASLASRSRTVVTASNGAVAAVAGATALAAGRDGALPRWLGALSATTAGVHLLSLVGPRVRRGPLAGDGVMAYLPYPLFAGWLVAVAVHLLRADRAAPKAPPDAVQPDRRRRR